MITGCGKFEDEILGLVYDELDPAAVARFRAHAADCPACAAAVSEMSALRRLSAQAIRIDPPAALDDAVLAAARAVADEAVAAPQPIRRPVVEDKPAFFDLLRAWLLHPAVAGAAVLAVVLTITFFISNKSTGPNAPKATVESVLSEQPLEIVGVPKAQEDATTAKESADRTQAVQEERAAASEAAKPLSAAHTAEQRAAAEPIPAEPEPSLAPAPEPAGRSNAGAAKRSESRASSRTPARRSSSSAVPYNAPKGTPSTGAEQGAGGLGEIIATPAPSASVERNRDEGAAQMDDLSGFAPPPSKKKAERAVEGDAEAAAEFDMPAAAGPSAKAPSTIAPGSADAYSRGMEAYRRGDCNTAVEELTQVTAAPAAYPGKVPSALHHIARCQKRSGRCAAAVTWYEDLIARYPGYSGRGDALYEAAACYKRLGRTEKARSTLQTRETVPGWESRAREAEAGL